MSQVAGQIHQVQWTGPWTGPDRPGSSCWYQEHPEGASEMKHAACHGFTEDSFRDSTGCWAYLQARLGRATCR